MYKTPPKPVTNYAYRLMNGGKRPPKPPPRILNWRFKLGDMVEIMSGLDAGKQGKIIMILEDRNKMLIKGIRARKIFRTPNQLTGDAGGYVETNGLVHYKEVSLIDPETKQPTETVTMQDKHGEILRLSAATGALMPIEKHWLDKRYIEAGPKDTLAEEVELNTYVPTMFTFEETIQKLVKDKRMAHEQRLIDALNKG